MTIQDQRRKDFEAWFENERRAAWNSFYKACPELAESDPSPGFGMGNKEGFWNVWNAALDSVEVNLKRPPDFDITAEESLEMDPEDYEALEVQHSILMDVYLTCKDAIEAAGLRVKG